MVVISRDKGKSVLANLLAPIFSKKIWPYSLFEDPSQLEPRLRGDNCYQERVANCFGFLSVLQQSTCRFAFRFHTNVALDEQ